MTKRRFAIIFCFLPIIWFLLCAQVQATAVSPELLELRATAYCVSGTTYSGKSTRVGIAAAHKDWIGKTAIVYQRLPNGDIGEVIGVYEIYDTGATEGITSGNVIDIWCPDLDSCQEFMNRVYEDGCKGKVYVQLFDAVG